MNSWNISGAQNKRTSAGVEPFTRLKFRFSKKPDPPIKELSADRAHLFVKTFARKDGDCEFLVFNHQGRALGRVNLPVTSADAFDDYLTGRLDRYYAFEGDFYYFLRENETEEAWELHKVRWRDKIQNP